MPSKTAIIYRDYLWLDIRQNIDDITFNITDLAKIHFNKTWQRKDVSEFIKNKSTEEYISYLISLNTGNPVLEVKRWKFGWTWVCKELFIDFAMWISIEFKHWAINFIIQWLQLAWKRNELKDWYKAMTKAIAESWSANYREEATMINVLCTGSCASNQRARLWIDKMKQLDQLQMTNASLIKAWLSLEQRKDILVKSL